MLGREAVVEFCWSLYQKKLGIQEELEQLLQAKMDNAGRFTIYGLSAMDKRIHVLRTLLQGP